MCKIYTEHEAAGNMKRDKSFTPSTYDIIDMYMLCKFILIFQSCSACKFYWYRTQVSLK